MNFSEKNVGSSHSDFMNFRIFDHKDFEEPNISNRIGTGEFGTVHKLQEKGTG